MWNNNFPGKHELESSYAIFYHACIIGQTRLKRDVSKCHSHFVKNFILQVLKVLTLLITLKTDPNLDHLQVLQHLFKAFTLDNVSFVKKSLYEK